MASEEAVMHDYGDYQELRCSCGEVNTLGFYQEGSVVKCHNCGRRFKIVSLPGTKVEIEEVDEGGKWGTRIYEFEEEVEDVDAFLNNIFSGDEYWYWNLKLDDEYWKILGVHLRLGKFTFEMTRNWTRFYIRDNEKLIDYIIGKIEEARNDGE